MNSHSTPVSEVGKSFQCGGCLAVNLDLTKLWMLHVGSRPVRGCLLDFCDIYFYLIAFDLSRIAEWFGFSHSNFRAIRTNGRFLVSTCRSFAFVISLLENLHDILRWNWRRYVVVSVLGCTYRCRYNGMLCQANLCIHYILLYRLLGLFLVTTTTILQLQVLGLWCRL